MRPSSSRLALAGMACLSATTAAIRIPDTRGPYLVQVRHVELVDTSRIDPYAANASDGASSQPRRLMASVFNPLEYWQCEKKGYAPYMNYTTGACFESQLEGMGFYNGSLSSFELPLCLKAKNTKDCSDNLPHGVLVFSHALGTPRLLYSALASEMASKGWLVMTLDHPYDSCVVEFPDGSAIYGIDIEDGGIPALTVDVQVRAQDIAFATKQLRANGTASGLLSSNLSSSLPTQLWGHSVGGASAFLAALNDPSIPSVANLDGELFSPLPDVGLGSTPSLLFASFIHNLSSNAFDPTWPEYWNASLSNKNTELVHLEEAAHNTFTDLPLLAELLDLKQTDNLTALVGTTGGYQARKAITSLVDRWFRMTMNSTVSDSLCSYPGVKSINVTDATFCS